MKIFDDSRIQSLIEKWKRKEQYQKGKQMQFFVGYCNIYIVFLNVRKNYSLNHMLNCWAMGFTMGNADL